MEKLLLVNVKGLERTYCFVEINPVVKKVRELGKDLILSNLSSEAGGGSFASCVKLWVSSHSAAELLQGDQQGRWCQSLVVDLASHSLDF